MVSIFSDINVRIKEVDDSDNMVVYDYDAIKQSLILFIRSKEQETPYYRAWGLNLEQFLHMPLNFDTGDIVYEYIRDKIERFFSDSIIILEDKSLLTVDYDNESIKIDLVLQIIETGEEFNLPTIEVISNT